MKRIPFNIKGENISNIKIGNIICMTSYTKDMNESNEWKHISFNTWDNEEWEVTNVIKINENYFKLKLQRVNEFKNDRNKSYFPKKTIIFDINGVSKNIYSSSSTGYSSKNVITLIK